MKCHGGKRWRRETPLAANAGSRGGADDGALAARDTKGTTRRNENPGSGPDLLPRIYKTVPFASEASEKCHVFHIRLFC